MYKSLVIDISAELGFDEPGVFAKIIPMAYWPNGIQRDLALRYPQQSVEAVESGDMSAMFVQVDNIIETLPYLIVDWNLKDFFDNPLPLPRTVAVVDNEGTMRLTGDGARAYKQIPLPILFLLFNRAQEDTGDVPPTKPSESHSLQVVRSAEEAKLRDSLVNRGVVTQTADGRTILNVEVPEDQADLAKEVIMDSILTGQMPLPPAQPERLTIQTPYQTGS